MRRPPGVIVWPHVFDIDTVRIIGFGRRARNFGGSKEPAAATGRLPGSLERLVLLGAHPDQKFFFALHLLSTLVSFSTARQEVHYRYIIISSLITNHESG
jgi:hypothetical protein